MYTWAKNKILLIFRVVTHFINVNKKRFLTVDDFGHTVKNKHHNCK